MAESRGSGQPGVGKTRFSTTGRVDELLTATYGPFLLRDTTRPLRAYCARRSFVSAILSLCAPTTLPSLIQGFINALEFTPRLE